MRAAIFNGPRSITVGERPGRVFDYEADFDGVPGAYAAMDERRAVKALIRIGRAA